MRLEIHGEECAWVCLKILTPSMADFDKTTDMKWEGLISAVSLGVGSRVVVASAAI